MMLTDGCTSDAVRAGFTTRLLVPVLPYDAEPGINCPKDVDPRDLGKRPMVWSGKANGWRGFKSWWSDGATDAMLEHSEAAGGNVGLLLGKGTANERQYIFLDFDTDPDPDDENALRSRQAKQICAAALSDLVAHLGYPVWVRLTRPGRLGVLLVLERGQETGAKLIVQLANARRPAEKLGKIELLTRHLQAVIGGTHPYGGGTPIRWYRSDQPADLWTAPRLGLDYPRLPSRDHIDTVIDVIRHGLASQGVASLITQGGTPFVAGTEGAPEPGAQEAPSAEALIELFASMPHPPLYDRHDYVNVMKAAAGCVRSSVLTGTIKGLAAEADCIEAACAWAARWVDPHGSGTSYETERAVWDSDWQHHPADHIGYRYIKRQAQLLGVSIHTRDAQHAFKAEPAPQNRLVDETGTLVNTDSTRHSGMRAARTRGLNRVIAADVVVADAVEAQLADSAFHIRERKQWIIWHGSKQGWSEPNGTAQMREWIEDELSRYVGTVGAELPESKREKLLSAGRIDAIEKILCSRSQMRLAASRIDCVDTMLQTAGGAYDLSTGGLLDAGAQMKALDCRMAPFVPREGPCPLFDSLILLLANNDAECVSWLWAFLGYVILGRPVNHVFLTICGPGDNGKSRFGEIVLALLGSYAAKLESQVILATGKHDHLTGLRETFGKRFWFISETSEGEKYNTERLKGLTGGDSIKARGMGENMQVASNQGVLLVVTNNQPHFHSIDDAVIRRFRLLESRLRPKVPDPQFQQRVMESEAPQILWRMIQEAKVLVARDYLLPPVPLYMQRSTASYYASADAFAAWFGREVAMTGDFGPVPVGPLKQRFDAFCERIKGASTQSGGLGAELMSEESFIARLKKCFVIVTDWDGHPMSMVVGGKRVPAVACCALRIAAVA